ncbi:acyltransferase-like protein [Marinilabilia salmonicolor]|jgi:surface polysaccharide O-acyltransferase-like enzyme|uniref:acyltransferase family protein n=1 Tax=Marinilabilia salmonicolor TaxID=989 RepID=UPI000D080243|nr:acyltransferase [Marinilabilia salmonicolor]PRY90321.1 acyltransferase-like protein [Marinilabilia salmonicolor]
MKNNSKRNPWVDNLRSTITIMVVAHHSALSYTTFAWFDNDTYINSTHPVVDSHRWVGLDIFQNFNDVFFMALMFLIGGLFLSRSIIKKGPSIFIRERFFRLFIPFLLLGTLFMLIAYFPPFFISTNDTNILHYIQDFFIAQRWPGGPPWFIWVLFLFNLIFAGTWFFLSKTVQLSGRIIKAFKNHPIKFMAIIFVVTWILYVPLAYYVGAGTWVGFGPFDFQLSRILLYFGYFFIGIKIGTTDFSNTLFNPESPIVTKWWLWVSLALIVYTILTTIAAPLTDWIQERATRQFYAWMIYLIVFSASCTLSSIALITTFRRFINTENYWWDSISQNAYMIYLIHYIFVLWSQYFLLTLEVHAFIKFLITFISTLTLSWMTSHFLHKISIIRQYI